MGYHRLLGLYTAVAVAALAVVSCQSSSPTPEPSLEAITVSGSPTPDSEANAEARVLRRVHLRATRQREKGRVEEILAPTPNPTLVPTTTPTPLLSLSTLRHTDSVRVAVKGDFGWPPYRTGKRRTTGQPTVTQAMCEWRERMGFSYVLTVGDNFYAPDGIATKENYFDPEACLYSDPLHQWRATWGNHHGVQFEFP